MSIDFETLTTQPVYNGFNYLSLLRRLLPRGPIWGFTQSLEGELLQDLIPPGEELQDEFDTGAGYEIQDTVDNPENVSTSLLGRLFAVIADELAKIESRAFYLLQESTPGLSVELLEDWEKEAGLPDSCSSTLELTVPERQLQVHAKLYGENQTTTPAFLIDYAELFGFTITIDEDTVINEPFITGVARTGRSRLVGYGARSIMTITVTAGTGNLDQLKCIFKKLKPSHVVIIWVDAR